MGQHSQTLHPIFLSPCSSLENFTIMYFLNENRQLVCCC